MRSFICGIYKIEQWIYMRNIAMNMYAKQTHRERKQTNGYQRWRGRGDEGKIRDIELRDENYWI